MAYLKNWTDNFFQIFFVGTSWVALSINNIKTRASREMTSRTNIIDSVFNTLLALINMEITLFILVLIWSICNFQVNLSSSMTPKNALC